jgi:hypothetical protein
LAAKESIKSQLGIFALVDIVRITIPERNAQDMFQLTIHVNAVERDSHEPILLLPWCKNVKLMKRQLKPRLLTVDTI